jgi:hypothetical protein
VTDLHAQLLARVDDLGRHLVGCVSCSTCEASALTRALKATLELHSPRVCACELATHIICAGCPGRAVHGRCHTVRAVARELGVEAGSAP